MLVRKFIPPKFLFGVGQIILAGILMGTANVYPSTKSSYGEQMQPKKRFIAGCALIIVMVGVQIAFTFIGINIYNARINFENMIFNGFGLILLIWFALNQWDQRYIWYIWGFLWQFFINYASLYPFFNEIFGMASVLFHSRKIIFQKYRSEQ